MTLVFKRSLGSVTRKAVLLAMADAANDDGSGIWKAADTIANQCDLSKRTVLRTWKELEAEGLIRRVGTRSVRGGEVIIWGIDTRAVSALPRPGDILSPSDTESPLKPDDTLSPGDTDDTNPVTLCPKPDDSVSPKPSLNHPIEPSCSFEDAWTIYRSSPLKANQTKKLAKAQWPKAVKKAGSAERILKAIKSEVALRKKPKGFVANLPDMHRWLSRECWQDVEDREPSGAKQELSREDWRAAFREFADSGTWLIPDISPAPNHPDCKGPADMIEHYRTISKHGEAA